MRANKPDFLAECASAAIRMGISYGQYMARRYDMGLVKNPHTEPEPEPDAVCKCCGKPFLRTAQNRVYCSAECKYEGDLKMKRKKYKDTREEQYTEILELQKFCDAHGIHATREKLFDGARLCFANGCEIRQNEGAHGFLEPVICCSCDFRAITLTKAKKLVLDHRDRLNGEAPND